MSYIKMNNRKRKNLMDIETDSLTETGFVLLVDSVDKLNRKLAKRGEQKRASYTLLSDFNNYKDTNPYYKLFVEKAKIILRKEKIKKITNGI